MADDPSVRLGDVIAALTRKLGLASCGSCEERRKMLNAIVLLRRRPELAGKIRALLSRGLLSVLLALSLGVAGCGAFDVMAVAAHPVFRAAMQEAAARGAAEAVAKLPPNATPEQIAATVKAGITESIKAEIASPSSPIIQTITTSATKAVGDAATGNFTAAGGGIAGTILSVLLLAYLKSKREGAAANLSEALSPALIAAVQSAFQAQAATARGHGLPTPPTGAGGSA